MGEICYLTTTAEGRQLNELQERLLAMADQSYEFASRARDAVAIRAHNRALALSAARIALHAADIDRERMHTAIISLRGVCLAAVNMLHDCDTPKARNDAKAIFDLLGESEAPFKRLADDVKP